MYFLNFILSQYILLNIMHLAFKINSLFLHKGVFVFTYQERYLLVEELLMGPSCVLFILTL